MSLGPISLMLENTVNQKKPHTSIYYMALYIKQFDYTVGVSLNPNILDC